MPGGSRNRTSAWWESEIPNVGPTGTAAVMRAMDFEVEVPGRVFGMRVYAAGFAGQPWAMLATRVSGIVTVIHQMRQFADIDEVEAAAWRNTWFHPTVRVEPGTTYAAYVTFPAGRTWQKTNYMGNGSGITRNGIKYLLGAAHSGLNYFTGTVTHNFNAYGIDVLFRPDEYTPLAYP